MPIDYDCPYFCNDCLEEGCEECEIDEMIEEASNRGYIN